MPLQRFFSAAQMGALRTFCATLNGEQQKALRLALHDAVGTLTERGHRSPDTVNTSTYYRMANFIDEVAIAVEELTK